MQLNTVQLGQAGNEATCTLLGGLNCEEHRRCLYLSLHAEHRRYILQCL